MLNLISNALKFTDTGSITARLSLAPKTFQLSNSHLQQILKKESSSFTPELFWVTDINTENFSEEILEGQTDLFMSKYNSNQNYNPSIPKENRENLFDNKLCVLLEVIDTGIGIPKADQQSLFKLFGKTSSNHDRNKTG
mmetsp:Transcript_9469/g.10706  ORF Transcript_9469/g.10706 Transcript_9469/m.10706 type:complete len:139 (+) Transcript_9469:326-742(+)